MKRKVLFCTPKAFYKFKDTIENLEKEGWEVAPTTMVYMNLFDKSWTEEMCDSVIYLCEDWQPEPFKFYKP